MSTHEKPDLDAAFQWCRSNAEILRDYCGQWVAISPAGLLAYGYDLEEVLATSKSKGYARPLLYKVAPKAILALWLSLDVAFRHAQGNVYFQPV